MSLVDLQAQRKEKLDSTAGARIQQPAAVRAAQNAIGAVLMDIAERFPMDDHMKEILSLARCLNDILEEADRTTSQQAVSLAEKGIELHEGSRP